MDGVGGEGGGIAEHWEAPLSTTTALVCTGPWPPHCGKPAIFDDAFSGSSCWGNLTTSYADYVRVERWRLNTREQFVWFPSIVSALRRSSNQHCRSSLLTNHRQSRCRSVSGSFSHGVPRLCGARREDEMGSNQGPRGTFLHAGAEGGCLFKGAACPGRSERTADEYRKKSPGAWEQMAHCQRPIGCGLDCDERTTSPIWI